MPRSLPAPSTDFIGLDGLSNLATGGEPPLLLAHRAAFERFAADKAAGYAGYHRHWEVVDRVRAAIARLTGLGPDDIALPANASEAIMRVVSAIDWRPGDNAVVPRLDYASGRFALASLKPRGVELRLAEPEGWAQPARRLLAACDARTRLVYVSQVNALTGEHADIGAIAAALEGSGITLMVDASHALGVVPVDARIASFTVACSYKFMLGIHEGILCWNRSRHPEFLPAGAGWYSGSAPAGPASYAPKDDARRAEYGNVGHLGAYLLEESVAYLESFGIGAIAAHVRALSGRMIEGMSRLGLDVMTPAEPCRRAASAAFAWTRPEQVVAAAAREGILVWGDNGRIRASAHLFTTAADVERFLDRLPVLLGRGAGPS